MTQRPPASGWRWCRRLSLLALLVGLGLIAPYLGSATELVRLRNAWLLNTQFDPLQPWTPAAVPPAFLSEKAVPAPEMVRLVESLGVATAPDDWARARLISQHLLGSSPKLNGGAIQSDLRTTYRRIVQQGDGYCADFVQTFEALAHAAGLFSRSWAFSFDGYGGHGHVFAEIWNRQAGRWQLLDVFNNYYFSLGDEGAPLAALEFRAALLRRDPSLRLHALHAPARPGFVIEAKAWDYFQRGAGQWYLWLGNNGPSHDQQPLVGALARVSVHAEQLAAISLGLQPQLAIAASGSPPEPIVRLRQLQQRLLLLAWLMPAALALLLLSHQRLRRRDGGRVRAQVAGALTGPILIVGPLPPPAGGMANQCEQLLRLLRAEGLEVRLLRTNAPYRPAFAGKLPVVRALVRLLPYLLQARRELRAAAVVHILANSGWAWHLFVLPVARMARRRGVPFIINYRGGLADEFFSQGPAHVRRLLGQATLRVTPSAFLQRVFAKHGLSAEIIPNIVDLSRFEARPLRDVGSTPRLLVARNLEAIYDNATAIRAFALVREHYPLATLVVAGEGPQRAELLGLAAQLGLGSSVEFVGRVDNAGMPHWYAQADCALNASTVDNMPISILEAFASGVPMVSTSAGGIPDLLDDGQTGLLVPIGDHRRMADSVLRLLADRELAQRLRAAALLQAQRYAWPQVRPLWLDAYRRAINSRETIS